MSVLLLALGLARAQQVEAEQGFDAYGFALRAYDGDLRDPLTLMRPGRLTPWDWFAGGVLSYANAPLVLVEAIDGEPQAPVAALDHVISLNLSAGVALHERVRLDVAMPLHLFSVGLDGTPQGGGAGDLRATAQVILVAPDAADEGFGFGVHGQLDAPSGASRKFLGQRGVAGGWGVEASYARDILTVTAEAGMQFIPRIALDNLANADQVTLGLGVGLKAAERIGVTLEGRGAVAFQRNAFVGAESPFELAMTGRYRSDAGGHGLIGVAAGVPRGVGAARFRVFAGAGFGRISRTEVAGITDRDGDGFLDPDDACPDDPETVNGLRDEDGCPDALARIEATATWQGEPVPGATLTFTAAAVDPVVRVQGGGPVVVDVPPQTAWQVAGDLDCLHGAGAVEVGEGTAAVAVPLAAVRRAPVRWVVRDGAGAPLPGAVVTWQGSGVGCAPEQPLTLIDGGGEQEVGRGEHAAFVELPGFRIHRAVVDVTDDAPRTFEVVLEPTKIAMKVDEIAILEKVFFATDEAVILPQSFPLLQEVADTLLAYPRLALVEVQGHTDSRGSDAYNLDLSQRRAEAVRAFLIERGVAAERLVAVGYGEGKPIADNATAEGMDRNRRVQFLILRDDALPPE